MIRRALQKAKTVFWLLPGFLLWASFPPMGEAMDALFALAPLLWLSRQGAVKTSVVRWFLNGFLFWFATLAWMPAIVKNGGPWPLVVLGWGALAAYCALYFAAFGWLSATLWSWVRPRAYVWRLLAIFLAEPILWAGLELVRSRAMGGFAWNQLGVLPVNCGFGAPAAFGGVYLLSMVVVLVNGTVASVAERVLAPWQAARRRSERILKLEGGDVAVECDEGNVACVKQPLYPPYTRAFETVLPLLIVFALYGACPASEEKEPSSRALRVAMVQRNFPCVFRSVADNPFSEYGKLFSNVAPLSPDLLVLGESALAEIGPIGSSDAAQFASWACEKASSKAVLAGGGRRAGGKEYNSAALYAGSGAPQIYDKVHLVPFGEFIPGDKWITALQKFAPVGSCSPGELKLLNVDGVKLGVAICFEDTDSAQIRRLAEMGADLLVFITNDSWFSQSDEPVQHAWQAVARAVETGLSVVRVGNSGVTGVISPQGRSSWLIDADGRALVDRPGTLFDRVAVPAKRRLTPYVRFGDAPLFAAFLLLALGIAVPRIVQLRKFSTENRKGLVPCL